MRCPKCHYLSFDPEPRCKNCGYDLDVPDAELALRTEREFSGDEPDLPLRVAPSTAPAALPVTLELVHPVREAEPDPPLPQLPPEPAAPPSRPQPSVRLEPLVTGAAVPAVALTPIIEDAPAPPPVVARPAPAVAPVRVVPPPAPQPLAASPAAPPPIARSAPSRSPHTTTDLPLFVKAVAGREEVPAARPPLSVRRAAPEVPRSAPPPPRRRVGPLDHDLLEDLRRMEREEAAITRADARAISEAAAEKELEDVATPGQRVGAAALDGMVLGGISLVVLWGTLRLCNVGVGDLPLVSVVPLLVFLGTVVVGYFLMFTAAEGQTLGKMLTGIRVVNDEDAGTDRLRLGQASWRALLAVASLLIFGLGWIPALFGRGLALHDRLAHTRVVRA
jgi:uncharacterized RDD family membrane protein YckC